MINKFRLLLKCKNNKPKNYPDQKQSIDKKDKQFKKTILIKYTLNKLDLINQEKQDKQITKNSMS